MYTNLRAVMGVVPGCTLLGGKVSGKGMACLLHIYSTCARDIQHIKKACKVEARCWKEGLVF